LLTIRLRALKIRPIKGEGPGEWGFTDKYKWILWQAVQPFVTDEVFQRKKIPYNALMVQINAGDSLHGPLQGMLKQRVTKANLDTLGLFHWEFVRGLLEHYLTAPEFPPDGGIDGKLNF
jgi:asparagine synthase (glutamine-hydrolysing)